MESIDVGKISVSPFEFESILQIKIEKEINNHSTLYVYGIIKDDKQITPVTSASDTTVVKCENDGQLYFTGILENIKITCIDDVRYLEVSAISNTILLDTEKHKRSFQDEGQNYKAIVESVIKDCSGKVTFNAAETKVENIILQYDETDWQFAKRLATHTQDVLIPIVDDKPAFHFGVPDSGSAKIESVNYSIAKDFDLLRRMSSESEPLTVDDVTVYSVLTDEYVYELGEKFNLNGVDLHISNVTLTLMASALTVLYTLRTKKAISAPKVYNQKITGLVLDGTVLKVENDDIKIHLTIDADQDESKAHLFHYATGYSAETHTGLYLMPEVGDTVSLLFPNEDEKFAYAVSSVRQEDSDKTKDPLIKYFRTTFGKEIKFEEKEILITSKDDETYIRINEEDGVEIITPNPVLVQSGSTINIESEDDMTVIAGKNLFVQAEDSIELSSGGSVIKVAKSDGINISTDKKFSMVSNDVAAIESKKDLTQKSGKNLKLDGGTKVTAAGGSGIELSSSGSSIKLAASGVDIKGSMIKEN